MAFKPEISSQFKTSTTQIQGSSSGFHRYTLDSDSAFYLDSFPINQHPLHRDDSFFNILPSQLYERMPLIQDSCKEPFPYQKQYIQDLEPPLSGSDLSNNIRDGQESKMIKNSNVVKKIGRIILNHIQEFKLKGVYNKGVKAMMHLLRTKGKDNIKFKSLTDIFNFTHLKALINQCPPAASRNNLRVARKLFNRVLRKQIFQSPQIKDKSKLTYLNTLKCSGLRFCNQKLALRLQVCKIID